MAIDESAFHALAGRVDIHDHDLHELRNSFDDFKKRDFDEVKRGVRELLGREAARPKPTDTMDLVKGGLALFAFAGFMIGVVQWQIQASMSVDRWRLDLMEKQISSLYRTPSAPPVAFRLSRD